MVYQLTEEESKELRIIKEDYIRLIRKSTEREKELRPDGYTKRGVPNVKTEDFDKWVEAGSDEWKKERKRGAELLSKSRETIHAYTEAAYDNHFKKIADDPEKIVEDAYDEVDRFIFERYTFYANMRENSDFSAREVRLQDDGSFKLDAKEIRDMLINLLNQRHIKALPKSLSKSLFEYIDDSLAMSPYITAAGELGALVKENKKSLTVNKPSQYKRPNTKVSNKLFGNELTTEDRNHFIPVVLNKKKNVIHYSNFIMPSNVISAPQLDAYDERVYACIFSCLAAGNHFIPYTTLYNSILGNGPGEDSKEMGETAKKDITETLHKFDGKVAIDNDPNGDLSKADPDFKRIRIREALLFYQEREEIVHGQNVEGIAIPPGYVPVLFRYAETNRNEIITDRIESICVDGLKYSRRNVTIASATYNRVREIQYDNDQKKYDREIPENKRTIRYDYIAEKAGLDFSSMTPTERNRLKKKINDCMNSYQRTGHFDRFEHKKDSTRTYYAVVLYFVKPRSLK